MQDLFCWVWQYICHSRCRWRQTSLVWWC